MYLIISCATSAYPAHPIPMATVRCVSHPVSLPVTVNNVHRPIPNPFVPQVLLLSALSFSYSPKCFNQLGLYFCLNAFFMTLLLVFTSCIEEMQEMNIDWFYKSVVFICLWLCGNEKYSSWIWKTAWVAKLKF